MLYRNIERKKELNFGFWVLKEIFDLYGCDNYLREKLLCLLRVWVIFNER